MELKNSKNSKKKSKKILFIFKFTFLSLLILLLAFFTLSFFYIKKNLQPVETLEENISITQENGKKLSGEYVTIPTGMSIKAIGDLLQQKGLIHSSFLFYYAVRFPQIFLKRNAPIVFKSGVYEISPFMSTIEVIELFLEGKQAFIKTVIPEGLTIKKVAKLLNSNGVCDADDFVKSTTNKNILDKYSIQAENCEGFLFPDTYFFYPNMNSDEIVDMMIQNFFSNLKKIEGFETADSIDYQKLILASIVEREYRVDEEAPLIASVFTNRIEVGMGLESCATIEYILTEILGRPHPDIITYNDLKINNPYNTYKWAAIPPGPISNPGIIALSAALNPAKTDYLFFTLTDSISGSHTFSKTLKSHAKATAEFRTKRLKN